MANKPVAPSYMLAACLSLLFLSGCFEKTEAAEPISPVVDVHALELRDQWYEFREESPDYAHTFYFDVNASNVGRVTLRPSFLDDLPGSRPDVFSVTLYAPDGKQLGEKIIESGADRHARACWVFEVGAPAPFDCPSGNFTYDKEKWHGKDAGRWTVKVRLVDAGDCPFPPTLTEESLGCGLSVEGRADRGNKFFVGSVYTYITEQAQSSDFGDPCYYYC